MENQLKNMEFSLRGRWCEQMIENEMLPNLSAADVARCAELSFSCILACSETVDLWQAEGCGREDWQEMGGGLYLEILSVLWLSDRTVRCVRWLYIQVIFKDSFTEPAARSCQAEEKCQSGFFFVCFLALSENLCAQHLEWKRAILSVLENTVRYIYDFLNCWEFRLAYSGKHQ